MQCAFNWSSINGKITRKWVQIGQLEQIKAVAMKWIIIEYQERSHSLYFKKELGHSYPSIKLLIKLPSGIITGHCLRSIIPKWAVDEESVLQIVCYFPVSQADRVKSCNGIF